MAPSEDGGQIIRRPSSDVRRPIMVGLGGLEPPTSRLSSARSNQLSYKPLAEDGERKTDDGRSFDFRSLSSVLCCPIGRETKAAQSRKMRPFDFGRLFS